MKDETVDTIQFFAPRTAKSQTALFGITDGLKDFCDHDPRSTYRSKKLLKRYQDYCNKKYPMNK